MGDTYPFRPAMHVIKRALPTKGKWDKVFKSGPSKICGRQPLKSLKGYGLLK